MSTVEFVAVIVAANLLAVAAQVALIERRSRARQWERFGNAIREVDERCRRAGWLLQSATFRPGFITGRGEVTWRRGDETFTSPVAIDARETTREASRPW